MAVFLIVAVLAWVARGGWEHARADYQRSRDAEVKKAAKGQPGGKLPSPREAAVRTRHAWGYWAREATHGLPVVRTGLHTGWIAHKTARRQAEAARSEAAAAHAETEASVLKRIRDHHHRQMKAAEEMEKIYAEGTPEQPVAGGGPREQAQTVANIADYRRREAQKAEGSQREVPPLPSETVDRKPEPGPYARSADELADYDDGIDWTPQLPNWDDLPIDEFDDEDPTAGDQEPPPTRRPDGRPETESDRKFFDLRESGYEGPIDQDGNAVEDENADASRSPQPIPPSPTGGETVTATAEVTYDQQMTQAQQMLTEAEHELATIQASRIGNAVEAMGAMLVDPGNLSRAAEVDEALREREKAAQRTVDAVIAFRDGLRRDHGHVAEAHQSSPGGGAERAFYQN